MTEVNPWEKLKKKLNEELEEKTRDITATQIEYECLCAAVAVYEKFGLKHPSNYDHPYEQCTKSRLLQKLREYDTELSDLRHWISLVESERKARE